MGKEEAATPTETPSARCPYIESMAKNSFVALFHHLFFTVMSDQSVEDPSAIRGPSLARCCLHRLGKKPLGAVSRRRLL
jgi:hypothetical protein